MQMMLDEIRSAKEAESSVKLPAPQFGAENSLELEKPEQAVKS